MKKIILGISIALLSVLVYAGDHKSDSALVNTALLEVQKKYAPDTRVTIFDITATVRYDSVFLKGSTTSKEAKSELLQKIKEIGKLIIIDSTKTLPDSQLGDTLYGIVNVSVADIRTQNKFTSPMATQALLGTPIKLLEHDNWYRIQMPDTYYGWAHERQIVAMNKKEYNSWILKPKVIFTKHYGFAYSSPDADSPTVSDLVAGNILQFSGIDGDYFKVTYPDKREAYILRKEAQEYSIWLQSRTPSANSFVEMAKSMTGIPQCH